MASGHTLHRLKNAAPGRATIVWENPTSPCVLPGGVVILTPNSNIALVPTAHTMQLKTQTQTEIKQIELKPGQLELYVVTPCSTPMHQHLNNKNTEQNTMRAWHRQIVRGVVNDTGAWALRSSPRNNPGPATYTQ